MNDTIEQSPINQKCGECEKQEVMNDFVRGARKDLDYIEQTLTVLIAIRDSNTHGDAIILANQALTDFLEMAKGR